MRWIAVGLVTMAIYVPLWNAPFVYEDRNWIGAVNATDTFDPFRWPNRVVTQQTYQWQAVNGNASPRPLHLMNVLLHLLCGGLVYGLAMRVGLSRDAAWMSAVIFLWHPLNVAAVAYVSGRSDVLMTLFSVSAVWLALRKTWWSAVASVGACLLAGGSKELGALSFALVLWTWKPQWVSVLLWAVPPIAILLVGWEAYGVFWPSWSTGMELAGGQVLSLWRVLGLMVVPVGFSIDPDPWSYGVIERVIGAGALVWALWWVWAKTTAMPRWACGWIVLVLLPRVVLPTYEGIHDAHAYSAMVGFSVLAGAWMTNTGAFVP